MDAKQVCIWLKLKLVHIYAREEVFYLIDSSGMKSERELFQLKLKHTKL